MKKCIDRVVFLCAVTLVVAACGESGSSGDAPGPVVSTTSIAPSVGSAVVNTWIGEPVDTTRLPIGTTKVSLNGPAVGTLFACDAGNSRGGGAQTAGPWIDEAAGTWDLSKKVAVSGEVSWPMASYSEESAAGRRNITSNGLPVGQVTGTFPIAADDPAFAFDGNPNRITEADVSVSLPLEPKVAAEPSCLGKGRIGVLRNGVSLFASIDEGNRDAVVLETQDQCDGHPMQAGIYHYHEIPSCIRDAATGSSTVVGFAHDGFPIVVERDAEGNLPTNRDLDRCHGRRSPILLDGRVVETYHYSATFEFPYFIGCFAGSPN